MEGDASLDWLQARGNWENVKQMPLRSEFLNWCVLLASFAATWACLWASSHGAWWLALAGAVAFAFVNFTPFALMHEAVHGVASPSPFRNEVVGILAAVTLPTSFSMQRVAHLGHHRRNRTDQDLYDYYLPHQKKWLRNVWLYAGNLLGMYWASIPLMGLIYLVAPIFWCSSLFVERIAPLLGFGPYVAELARLPVRRVWPEVAMAFTYQVAVFWALGLTWVGWLMAHFLFALHWSALQYVDHAWSPRDVQEGAWNLKIMAPIRWLALNYHYHLAHHQHPEVRWTELPSLVPAGSYTPSFWSIYRSLWRGVRPAPPMGAPGNPAIFESHAT